MTSYAVSSGVTSSGVSLGSGDIMAISSGGEATDTTIGGGGSSQ